MIVEDISCPECSHTKKIHVTGCMHSDGYKKFCYECMKCGYTWYDEQIKENEDMKEKKIDWDKPLRVRRTKCLASLSFVASVSYGVKFFKEDGYTIYRQFDEEGFSSDGYELENIPEKQERWINLNSDSWITNPYLYKTKEKADENASPDRIARIKIEWEEGQFDD